VFLLFAALFIGVPIVEIWLLIEVGGTIGLGWTLAVCVATGVVGAYLAKRQGAQAIDQMKSRVSAGQIPAMEMFHALLIVVAGTLLMTPGYVTDAAGLLLLVPPVRVLVASMARGFIERTVRATPVGGAGFHVYREWQGPGTGPRQGPDVQAQPDVELLPPELAPRQPGTRPPKIIDID
jgi:UPF0716 protein FxsA